MPNQPITQQLRINSNGRLDLTPDQRHAVQHYARSQVIGLATAYKRLMSGEIAFQPGMNTLSQGIK